jgi:DNA-binding PadR family transcriptional regulator
VPRSPLSLADTPLPSPVFLILLVLADGDAHGYAIRKAIAARTSGAVSLDPGSLYRLIARLFDQNLIAEAGSTSDARRRIYKLTRLGRRVLEAEADRMATLASYVRTRARRRPREA